VRGYTYVSRNYVAGDQIFLVGFSRGAYTARALAGLIAAKGLLDATQFDLNDKVMAYRLGERRKPFWRGVVTLNCVEGCCGLRSQQLQRAQRYADADR
jgi:hypothetical protein